MNPEQRSKLSIIIAAVVFVAAGVYWHYGWIKASRVSPTTVTPPLAAPITKADIGSQIYSQANNPIENKLPGTVSPVSNPIQNVYKNPFE